MQNNYASNNGDNVAYSSDVLETVSSKSRRGGNIAQIREKCIMKYE